MNPFIFLNFFFNFCSRGFFSFSIFQFFYFSIFLFFYFSFSFSFSFFLFFFIFKPCKKSKQKIDTDWERVTQKIPRNKKKIIGYFSKIALKI